MKKIITILGLILVLSSCTKSPTEKMYDCINEGCNLEESSNIVEDYMEILSEENNLDINLEGYDMEGSIFSFNNNEKVYVSMLYANESLTYTDGFLDLEVLHSIYIMMKEDLVKFDTTTSNVGLSIGITIEEDINDYIYIFNRQEEDSLEYLIVELDGFVDDYEIFMENFYEKLSDIFSYNDRFIIRVGLAVDIGYIHIDCELGSDQIILDLNRYNLNLDTEMYLIELIDSIEKALDYEYDVVIDEE